MAYDNSSYSTAVLPKIVLDPVAPDLFSDRAEEAAKCCRSKKCNKQAQLRRFYDELVMWHDKVFAPQKAEEQAQKFNELLPFIQMMRAKAAYAQGRELIDQNFRDLFNNLVKEIKNPRTLRNGKLFFEAFLGYVKYYEAAAKY